MFKKCRKFVKDHKYEIIIGGIAITVSVAAYVGYKMTSEQIEDLTNKVTKNGKIALEALRLHVERINNEIEIIQESIDRLDPESSINKYHKIPERYAKIEELILQRTAIIKQIADVEE